MAVHGALGGGRGVQPHPVGEEVECSPARHLREPEGDDECDAAGQRPGVAVGHARVDGGAHDQWDHRAGHQPERADDDGGDREPRAGPQDREQEPAGVSGSGSRRVGAGWGRRGGTQESGREITTSTLGRRGSAGATELGGSGEGPPNDQNGSTLTTPGSRRTRSANSSHSSVVSATVQEMQEQETPSWTSTEKSGTR